MKGKKCSVQNEGFLVNWRARYVTNMQLLCYKHAVTMLTQPGHIDEQLKERLKYQKKENRNCLLKIVQSISYLSCQGIGLHKGKQDEESNFMQLLLLRAKDNEVLQK